MSYHVKNNTLPSHLIPLQYNQKTTPYGYLILQLPLFILQYFDKMCLWAKFSFRAWDLSV